MLFTLGGLPQVPGGSYPFTLAPLSVEHIGCSNTDRIRFIHSCTQLSDIYCNLAARKASCRSWGVQACLTGSARELRRACSYLCRLTT